MFCCCLIWADTGDKSDLVAACPLLGLLIWAQSSSPYSTTNAPLTPFSHSCSLSLSHRLKKNSQVNTEDPINASLNLKKASTKNDYSSLNINKKAGGGTKVIAKGDEKEWLGRGLEYKMALENENIQRNKNKIYYREREIWVVGEKKLGRGKKIWGGGEEIGRKGEEIGRKRIG
ncbi:hypothetical protein PRUPE_3G095100 [Prunus persica]|uniref:Uncharacterized protein n=1 Tax=Prunus persica TaxID=3760 RepID=A0A251PXS1_PRUPE|nr:hypothetical protein PRUPE_3G095100 [Prunus persica]